MNSKFGWGYSPIEKGSASQFHCCFSLGDFQPDYFS